jgi:hypothetical protein
MSNLDKVFERNRVTKLGIDAMITNYLRLERENAALRGWSKAQLDELHRISEALGTNDGHSSVTHIEILKEENAALREQLAAHLDWPKEPSDKMIRAGLRIMASDGALSAVSDIYEAMRLAHIKEKGK